MTNGSFEGELVDALYGKPLAETRVIAKAPRALDLTCQTFESTSDESGLFKFPELCGGETYDIYPADKTLFFDGLEQVDGSSTSTGAVQVKVWRTPPKGIYLLDGKELTQQNTRTEIGYKIIFNTEDERAYYPMELFKKLTRVQEGQYLVMSGPRCAKRMKFYPLIEEPRQRRFGNSNIWTTEDPWTYIGIKFKSNTDYERIEATPDPSRVTVLDKKGHQVRYLAAGALPPGQYAVFAKDDKRTYMFEF